MTKRMLIDATHAEETRVVVLDGSRLEDFDVETAAKRQLKGNIYLAKVVRVEPSLQAAFVEYGGGRHGFLAFGEIHPDYYQIPVADRQRLLEMQEAEARAEEEADDAAAAADEAAGIDGPTEHESGEHEMAANEPHETAGDDDAGLEQALAAELVADEDALVPLTPGEFLGSDDQTEPMLFAVEPPLPMEEPGRGTTQAAAMAQDFLVARDEIAASDTEVSGTETSETEAFKPEIVDFEAVDTILVAAEAEPTLGLMPQESFDAAAEYDADMPGADAPGSETSELPMSLDAEPIGLDDAVMEMESGQQDPPAADAREDEPRDIDSRPPARFMRSYKIQEVIRRRQILLIQVVKEERGSKGAALTTYISLAGRFSVLMPNSPRGGGISRKITSTADRRRLKEVTSELQIPRGMGLIVRTAGANRPKAEIKRDCEYLLELWDSIRDTTMASMAPALIHEEANLIKRAIRDNYSRDVDEVLVDGETGWRAARDFMRMLMPAHARKVILWNDPQPLFARNQVEAQLDAMLVPTVQLKSGGYLVINQTEALVAIDVNSGRSTRERGIEETALKTNLEAADEVARQLRLRDLAGLIVIDFIDMESRRNNTAVEKRMKDALKDDRARIQQGVISQFGLMELSRQRLRPSLAETSFTPCPHCGGTGHVRSTETSALAVLRAIEDEGAKRRAAEVVVHVAGAIALYVLNHKRVRIAEIEARYGMSVAFAADESLLPPETRIERLRVQVAGEASVVTPIPISTSPIDDEDDVTEEEDVEAEDEAPIRATIEAMETSDAPDAALAEATDTGDRGRKRRRRRGRREEGELPGQETARIDPASAEQPDLPMAVVDAELPMAEATDAPTAGELVDPLTAAAEEERGRRRGRRGGRRRRRDAPGELGEVATSAEGSGPEDEGQSSFDEPVPAYAGPTPADPFGGGVFDIYDAMERAEALAAAPVSPEPPPLEMPERPEVEGNAAEATVPSHAAEPELVEPASEPVAALEQPALDLDPEPVVEPDMAQPEPTQPEPDATPQDHAAQDHAAQDHAEPALAETETGVTATPPTLPVLIGASDGALEKKRGWWRG